MTKLLITTNGEELLSQWEPLGASASQPLHSGIPRAFVFNGLVHVAYMAVRVRSLLSFILC